MSPSFGEAVEGIRGRRHVYRKTLAKYMGIDPDYLEEIENDEVKPEVTFIERISDVLHLDLGVQRWLLEKLQHWKKGEGERRVYRQLRCHACLRPIARERAVPSLLDYELNGGTYIKSVPGCSGGKGVSLGTTCARKYGIVYTDDDW